MRLPQGLTVGLVLVLSVLVFSPATVTAKFFPNISSIPPSWIPNDTKSAWDAFQNFTGCRAGEKVDGLSKLKKYFNQFGYIPDLPANLTDQFDDAFESALRTYQKNFNLNVTGQLDDQTLKQIIRPRCGNADIVNGTTTMNSGKMNSSLHTVAHYSFFPDQPRWPSNRRDLKYGFASQSQLTDEVKSVFARAFTRWSEVIPMTFTQASSTADADIRIGFFSLDHGDGEPFDGPLGTLAHAFSPPSGILHLDMDENWLVSSDAVNSPSITAVDLESVAVHEIGHLLGLGHSSVEEAIMYPTLTSGTKKVVLANDDVEGIQILYGSNPNYNGTSSTPSTQQRETNGAKILVGSTGWRQCLLLVIGLIFFVL